MLETECAASEICQMSYQLKQTFGQHWLGIEDSQLLSYKRTNKWVLEKQTLKECP